MDWTCVDYLWIIVISAAVWILTAEWVPSDSDGTYSLQDW